MKNNHAFLNALKSQRKNNGINTIKNGLFCAVVNKICGFIKKKICQKMIFHIK